MTLAYLGRLLCICLAAFFVVHLALGLVVRALSPAAVRKAERMAPHSAARWLLALRMLPLIASLLVVTLLCIPSYLWWEPEAAAEEVGLACLTSALLGAAVWGISIARGIRATARSRQFVKRCRQTEASTQLDGFPAPVWIMEEASGSLMLAGILRPEIFVSRRLMTALSRGQLEVAIRHEGAHRISCDNLKRLLMLVSPEVAPFFRWFDILESHWSRFTEWAADDRAVDGDLQRSLCLAAALVRVARLAPTCCPSPAITSALHEGHDLAARVERLLRPATAEHKPEPAMPVAAAGASIALAALLVAVMLQPATLYSVHRWLEELIH